MKKLLILGASVLVPALSMISCKPQLHSNNPTPANYRILSYSKTTDAKISLPVFMIPRPVHESYRFYYRKDNNQVDHIVYITNDTANGNGSMNIEFSYYHDTIVKNSFYLDNNQLRRSDTFMQNSGGFIVSANTPTLFKSREKTTFEYLGQLLARWQSSSFRSFDQPGYRGSTITGPISTYTSVDGDFLRHSMETSLKANFLSNKFDTVKAVAWIYPPSDTVVHNNIPVNTYNDVLPNYGQKPVVMMVVDNRGNADTVGFTGSINNMGDLMYNESYEFYTTMANRPGDWLQVQSFTMFGNNIFRNKHLVKKITSVKGTMDISYSIDAYSKITQIQTSEKDEFLNTYDAVYDIQYEIFQ